MTTEKHSYTEAMQILVDEHKLIVRLLDLLPIYFKALTLESEGGRDSVKQVIYFIQNYADKFHQSKEEDVLFQHYTGIKEILSVMYQDHTTGRDLVSHVLKSLDNMDRLGVISNLETYRKLLLDHIKKEDEVIFPMMERRLSDSVLEEMVQQFQKISDDYGAIPKRCETIVLEFEKRFTSVKR